MSESRLMFSLWVVFPLFLFLQNRTVAEQISSEQEKDIEPSLGFYIQLGLENNLGIKQQNSSLSQEEIRLKKTKKEELYPQLDLELTSGQNKESKWVITDGETYKDVTISKDKSASVNASISRPHPLGGKLRFGVNYDVSVGDVPGWGLTIESQEPLSRYSRERLKKPFMDQEEQLEKEKLRLEERINEIIFQVSTSYVELQMSNLSILLKNNELKDLKDTLEITNLKFKKGIIPEIDILQMELQTSSLETEIGILKNQRNEKISRFCHLCMGEINPLGIWSKEFDSLGEGWLAKEKTQDCYREKIESLKSRVDTTDLSEIKHSPEVKIKYLEIEGAKRKINETMDLNAPFVTPFFRIKHSDDVRSEEIGLSVKFSIFDKGVKAEEIKLVCATLVQQEIELKNLLIENQIGLTTTLDNILDKEKRIDVQKKNLNLAGQIYEIAKIKHARGLISAKDLLDDHGQVFSKQKELLQLEIDLYLDYINIFKLTSQLYDAYQENLF